MPREQTRVPFLIEVVLELASGRRQARISDLSVGGCFIDSIVEVPEGETVAFELVDSAAGEAHPFTGRVVYSLPGVGFGVRFTGMNDGQRAFVERVVQSIAGPAA